MRMQLIFREGVASVRSADEPFYRTRSMAADDPRQVMIVLGVVEAPIGTFQGETAVDVVLGTRNRGLAVDLVSKAYVPDDLEYASELDLGGIANSLRTRSPGGFGNLLAHGTLYLRETRLPAAQDHVAFATIGIAVVGRGSVPERVMFDLEGAGSKFVQASAKSRPEAYAIGSTPGQTHQLPIWGWDDPKRSIYSTLTLELIDDIARLRRLEGVEGRTSGEDRELDDLMRGAAGRVVGISRNDRDFQRFRELAREMGLDGMISNPGGGYPDAGELADMDDAMGMVVRAVHAEREQQYAAPAPR